MLYPLSYGRPSRAGATREQTTGAPRRARNPDRATRDPAAPATSDCPPADPVSPPRGSDRRPRGGSGILRSPTAVTCTFGLPARIFSARPPCEEPHKVQTLPRWLPLGSRAYRGKQAPSGGRRATVTSGPQARPDGGRPVEPDRRKDHHDHAGRAHDEGTSHAGLAGLGRRGRSPHHPGRDPLGRRVRRGVGPPDDRCSSRPAPSRGSTPTRSRTASTRHPTRATSPASRTAPSSAPRRRRTPASRTTGSRRPR